jgi:glycosyltransferase involved in cell wall biosynthesis
MVPGSLRLLAGAAEEARRMAALLRGGEFDIAYFGIIGSPHVVMGIRQAVAAPLVGRFCVVPSNAPQDSDFAHRLMEWAAVRCFDGLIANANYGKEAWVRRTRISPARVRVIYNGIDVNAFEPRRDAEVVRAEIGVPASCPVVGMTARLHPMKGHVYLLRAAAEVAKAFPDVHVVLVGEGGQRSALERTAEELGIRGRVHFLGHRTDVADVTQVFDVAVLPSVAGEGFPHTVMEAMALRKPMVASRFSGIPEEVDDGVTGTLVPPGDAKALAEAITDLLRDPAKAQAFGEAGRRRVEEKFTLPRMLDETFDLFSGLVERRRRRAQRPRTPRRLTSGTASAGGRTGCG